MHFWTFATGFFSLFWQVCVYLVQRSELNWLYSLISKTEWLWGVFGSFPSHFFTAVRKAKNWFLYVPIGTGPLHKWSLNERGRGVTLRPSTRYDKRSKLYTVGVCSRFPCGRPVGRILLSFVQLCFIMSKRGERNHRSEKKYVWVVFPVVCCANCCLFGSGCVVSYSWSTKALGGPQGHIG